MNFIINHFPPTVSYFLIFFRIQSLAFITFVFLFSVSFSQDLHLDKVQTKHPSQISVDYFVGQKPSQLSFEDFVEKFSSRAQKDLRKQLLKELQTYTPHIKDWDFLNTSIFNGVENSYVYAETPQLIEKLHQKFFLQINWNINWEGLLEEIQSWELKNLFPNSLPKVLIMVGTEGPKSPLDPLSASLKKTMVDVLLFHQIPIISQKNIYDFLSKNPFRTSTDYGLRPEQLAEIGMKLHSDLIIRMSLSTKFPSKKSSLKSPTIHPLNSSTKDAQVALRVQIHRTKNVTPILSERIVKCIPIQDNQKQIPLDIMWNQFFSKKFPHWVAHTLCVWKKILQDGIPYEFVILNAKNEKQFYQNSLVPLLKRNKYVKSISPVKISTDRLLVVSLLFCGVFSELQDLILQHAKDLGLSFVRYESRSNKFFLRKI